MPGERQGNRLFEIVKKRQLVVAAFLALALAIVSSTFLVNNAAATPLGTVKLASGTCGSGFGSCPATLVCPSGTIVGSGSIDFGAFRQTNVGQIFGDATIVGPLGGGFFGFQTINISPNNYKFSGIANSDICSPGQPFLTSFSLTGACGTGVTADYATANGVRLTVSNENVACTK